MTHGIMDPLAQFPTANTPGTKFFWIVNMQSRERYVLYAFLWNDVLNLYHANFCQEHISMMKRNSQMVLNVQGPERSVLCMPLME